MLERVTQEKQMIEEEGRREKRKSDQLQESMTSLRMVSVISSPNLQGFRQILISIYLTGLSFVLITVSQILEEEQRKSEEKERKIQNFDRVIKETREMFDLKQSEVCEFLGTI